MAKKPFEIQDSTLRIGGVDLQAGGNGVVIPGVTVAATYFVEEVEDTDVDQTVTFPSAPIVIDWVTWMDWDVDGSSTGRASYTAELDNNGYIDEIELNQVGSYTSDVAGNYDMYAYTGSASPFSPFVGVDWTQIPFRPKMRPGDVQNVDGGGSLGNFEADGSELYAPDGSTIEINGYDDSGVKRAHITLNPDYPLAKMAVNTQRSWGFNENADYQMGNTWSDDGNGGGVISLTGVSQNLYDTINLIGRYTDTKIVLNGNTYTFGGWNGGGTVGVDAYFNLYTVTGPGGDPVAVSYFEITGLFENRILFDEDEGDYGIWLDNNTFRLDVGNDINLYAGDDLRLQGNDLVVLRNTSTDGSGVDIVTRYGSGNEYSWTFNPNGVLSGPVSEGSLMVYGLESEKSDLYLGIYDPNFTWPAISNILTSAVTRVSFVGSISALPDVGSISFTGITTWTQMNDVRYYYEKFDGTSISLYVDVGRTIPLDTTGFGGDYIQSTVNTYHWQQYTNNNGASNGWVDSVAYPGIATVPQGADVVSDNLTPGGESIAFIGLSQFEGIYNITFSMDTGTGRHYLGIEYTATWSVPGVATGTAVYTRDGYNVRLVPRTGSGPSTTAGRVVVESGLLELSNGMTLGGIGLTAPISNNIGIRTQQYITVSGLSEVGSGVGVIVFDTTNVDDITVVQQGWQINTGSEQSPIWEVVTSVDSSVPNQFTINIATDVEFSAGFNFEFRNPSVETHTWNFNDNGTLVTPAGGTISHANNDLTVAVTGLSDVIVLRTAGGDLVVNADASLTFNSGATISTTTPVGYGGQGLILSPDPGFGQGQGLRIYPTNAEVEHLHVTANDPANVDLFLGDDNQYVKVSRTGEIQIASFDNMTMTYPWTFNNDGKLSVPGLIQHNTSGNYINLNNDGGADLTAVGEFRLTTNSDAGGIGQKQWRFYDTGSLELPGPISSTSAAIFANTTVGELDVNGVADFVENVHMAKDLTVDGTINFTGTVTQNNITVQTGVFTGDDPSTGFGALYAGITQSVGFQFLPSTVFEMVTNSNEYTQMNYQNLSGGNQASAEYVITADNGTDLTGYIDMGMASSGWDGTQPNSLGTAVLQNDGFVYVQNGTGTPGGNLVLGATTSGRKVKIVAGGVGSSSIVAEFSAVGLSVPGTITSTFSGNLTGNVTGNVSGSAGSVDWTNVSNKPTFATVATTGSYTDLSNTPAIPPTYELPTATSSVLGGIKIGSGLSIDGNGIVSASGGTSLINGANVLKLVSAPASLVGVSGDTAGSIAIDGGYIYYCTRNYTGATYTYTVTTNATTASMNAYLPPANSVIGTLVYIQGPLAIQPQTNWTLTYNGTTYTIGAVGNPNNGVFTQVFLTNSGISIPANSTVTLNAPANANIWTRTAWNGIDRYGISTTTAAASGGGSLAYNSITGQFTFAPAVTTNPTFSQGITISGNVVSSQWGTTGIGLKISSATYTDTSSNGTSTNAMFHVINAPTLNSVNPTNYTNTSTLYIAGAPVAGTNTGFTNKYALNIASGDVNLSTGQVLTPARHAFRVYGSGTTNNLSTTQNTDGKLNTNNFASDFTQGSGFAIATGIFTAPAAGLYQVNLSARTSGAATSSNQIAVVKNYASSSSVVCMVEFGASSTMIHTGTSSVIKLAANDTLVVKVLAGTVNFDSNNSWSVAFLG